MSNSHVVTAAALTFHSLGIRPNSASRFTVAPQPGGLAFCGGKLAFGSSGQAVDVCPERFSYRHELSLNRQPHSAFYPFLFGGGYY